MSCAEWVAIVVLAAVAIFAWGLVYLAPLPQGCEHEYRASSRYGVIVCRVCGKERVVE